MTAAEAMPGDAIADLIAGSRQIVVYGAGALAGYAETLDWGLAQAQQALDLIAMRGGPVLVLEDVDTDHVTWWMEPRGIVLRVTEVADLGFSASGSVVVTDADGRVRPSPEVPAWEWHPSLRYFRVSQYTDDLFDSYRNMYLAVEAALSDVVPQRTKANGQIAEGEGEWLRRALTTVHSALPLGPYVPPGSADAVDGVFNDLYKGTRTALFHAKAGRPVLMPHGSAGRAEVTDGLERLSRLYIDLMRHYHGIARQGSVMTCQGFDLMTSFDADIAISADPSPALREDTGISPAGDPATTIRGQQRPDLSPPGLKFWLA